MIRRFRSLAPAFLLALLLTAPVSAQADFGFVPGSVRFVARNSDGTVASQASSHPYSYTVDLKFNRDVNGKIEGGEPRTILADLPPGLVGNPQAVPQCPRQLFEGTVPQCPPDTQVGVLRPTVIGIGQVGSPIYNMVPPPGIAAQIGFSVIGYNALENASVRSEEGYGLRVGVSVPIGITAATETIWGVPADPSHDAERGNALDGGTPVASGAPLQPFLTLPATCAAPLQTTLKAESKLAPGALVEESVQSLDDGGNPAPLAGCAAVPFAPKISAQPTTRLAQNPSGLDFELKLPNQGLLAPGAIAETEPKKTEVTLPDGVTVNPSLAEGIAVCAPAQFAAEKAGSAPGAGCPEASKIGSLVAQSPLIEEALEGSLYLAAPYDNAFGTLAALYLVARAPERDVIVKQAGKVLLDPKTGRLTTSFEGLPPIPYSSFKLHFREGGRAPLVTPPGCGSYQSLAKLTPFSVEDDSEAFGTDSSFQIERGPEGGACPAGGAQPFHPRLTAGTVNNAAGRYSAFNLRLSRTDAEQEFTHFSIKLPPGITAKLAGVPFCPDGAIAAAKARTGPHGGAEELASPSCPAASEVGRILVGAGVGGVLTYVPGKVYLAGPYNGSALSVAAITAAKAGPFDLGTVVVREALRINPETAEVFVDATGSDPIPHIIKGIPVHARDIRVYVDKRDFALNPTNCKRTSTASTVLGSGLDFASAADDQPVTVTSPFQAADCASLGFKPKLALSLKGGTRRSATPKFKAVLTYPKGSYANIASAQVTLPHSEFLEQSHIGTVCTRVQFKEGKVPGEKCPPASIYGFAKAITPLLDDPIEGPVYLRSSSHSLPDLVAAMRNGQINIDLVGRIDSVKGGRIRNSFESVPDAPVSKFILEMQGGKKGLLVNSTNLCAKTNRAIAAFEGQNGKAYTAHPALVPDCAKGRKGGAKKQKRSSRWILDSAW